MLEKKSSENLELCMTESKNPLWQITVALGIHSRPVGIIKIKSRFLSEKRIYSL